MQSITRRAWRPRHIFAWVLALGTLAPLLLSGCGGGGGINSTTTSSQGFRIVPAGGIVTPPISGSDATISGITFTTLANVVDAGVQVNVAQTPLNFVDPSAANNLSKQVGPAITEAFTITLSPTLPKFNNAVTLSLTLPKSVVPGDLNSQNSIRIYTYDHATKTWLVQPGAFTLNTTTGGGTVTGTLSFPSDATQPNTLQNALSDSGAYIVAYEAAPPPPTTI